MKTVRQLKQELDVNGDLAGLMEVLKGIAVSEFWALAKRQQRFDRFTAAFEGFFRCLDFSGARHPFAREQGALGIIMVTSNEGFMGGLNARVIDAALAEPEAGQAKLMIIGEQGAAYLQSLGRQFTGFPGIVSGECYEAAVRMKDHIMKTGLAGEFGRLVLFYPRPVSFMVQKIEALRLLPCTSLFHDQPREAEKRKTMIMESSVDAVVEYLVETWIVQKLFEVFEDSKLAEFSARTVRLEESTQALQEQRKDIQYRYFRERHEAVDAGMRDIYAAQIVRKQAGKKNKSEIRSPKHETMSKSE